MEEELSHPLTLWKLHHTTIAIVRGWKLLLLHRRLLTATAAQDGDRVSTVCIAAAAPAAPCFARLIISPLVSQTRSSLFEFSKKESAHAETVPCASRLLAQDRSLGAGSRKPAPPELSTGASETKTGRGLSSQVVNNSRVASILIRPAHVCIHVILVENPF